MPPPEHRPPDAPLFEQHRAELAGYAHAPYNFDPALLAVPGRLPGWRYDHYGTALPSELPGPPLAHGAYAAAREVIYRYAFPPPGLLVGIYNPAAPLEGRPMLLRARFLGFTFWFGVRVVDVVADEMRGEERVWGYGYRTLVGHFERGQINFSVHKHLATGAVKFRVAAVSQRGRIPNPFYWLGFLLFGRLLQRRFARQSLARMRALVAEALAQPQTIAAGPG